jgi:hypothetical protein
VINGSIVGCDRPHATGKKYLEAMLTVPDGVSADGIGLAGATMASDSSNSLGMAGSPTLNVSGTGAVLYNGTTIAAATGVGRWTAGGQNGHSG